MVEQILQKKEVISAEDFCYMYIFLHLTYISMNETKI